MRGGYSGVNYSLSPANYDGEGVGTSGDAVQFEAGMAGGRRRRRGTRRRSYRGGNLPKQGGTRRRRTRRSSRSRRSRRSRR